MSAVIEETKRVQSPMRLWTIVLLDEVFWRQEIIQDAPPIEFRVPVFTSEWSPRVFDLSLGEGSEFCRAPNIIKFRLIAMDTGRFTAVYRRI